MSQENACARCLLKTCICCLWCLEKCLNYLNQVTNKALVFFNSSSSSVHRHCLTCVFISQNAYAATAINSTSFCTSARDAFVILVENALRVATINAVGDFVLFLGKVRLQLNLDLTGVSCQIWTGSGPSDLVKNQTDRVKSCQGPLQSSL